MSLGIEIASQFSQTYVARASSSPKPATTTPPDYGTAGKEGVKPAAAQIVSGKPLLAPEITFEQGGTGSGVVVEGASTRFTSGNKDTEQSTASASGAAKTFLEYMSKTPEERYYEALLAEEGLTREQLAALPPDERAAVEAKIEEKIKDRMKLGQMMV